MSAQPSKELDDILQPHIASLKRLLDSPELNQSGAEAYPVIDYILQSKKKLDGVGAYSIPFCGDISSHEYAKIARWSSENIPGAFTLVVAHRKAGNFKKRVQARNEEWNNSELLKMAWADLMISYPADSFMGDVDLECLTTLEARMFEDSEEAGPAGNQQWGLDAGQHHRRWGVHLNIPNEWVMERDYSDTELERGPLFSDNSDATSADELSGVVAPSRSAEEEIAPVKCHPSLPAEECAPVKRRRASKRVQRERKRN
ncbi:hypothetical protein BD769DRAFT_79396 [Suillus cothurnatus]|nr:hypothetical protein BD769DRAFT_79396 [Suillus cothurnatus]